MKLSTITTKYSQARYDILFESLLLENQLEYLTKKYPEVDPQQIQQAIDLDRKNAEKLVLGLKSGTITAIEPGSVEAVAHLDPFAKASNKSATELAYDQAIKDAKQIHPKYWQWILRTKKDNPEAQFDESIFHYLEAEGLNTDDIKELSLDQISEASRKWHDEQFSSQQAGGSYTLTPQKDAVLTVGAYSWVPVNNVDARTEGSKMQNCIGTYCIPSENTKIFSLRNNFNNPHISLSVKTGTSGSSVGKWYIREIKGKQNKRPIPKYVPFALAMCEYLFKKGVKLDEYGDFWGLPSPDLHQYIRYFDGAIDRLKSDLIEKVTDEEINTLVLEKGVSLSFPQSSDDKKLFNRLSTQTFYKILASKKTNSTKLIKLAISSGKLDEQQTIQILEEYGASRSIEMLVKARFRPQQFIEELKKVHPDDFSSVYANYNDAIEAYEGTDDYFGELLLKQIGKSENNDYAFAGQIIDKSPSDVLQKILDGTVNPNYTVHSADLSKRCFDTLMSRAIKTSDSQAVINVLSLIPSDYITSDYRKFSSDIHSYTRAGMLSTDDILFSVDYDDIPNLYEAGKHNPIMRKAISVFVNGLDELGMLKTIPSGTSQDVASAAESIMNTDDVNALDDIRRTTKSRGIKIMANRKIARLNRSKQ